MNQFAIMMTGYPATGKTSSTQRLYDQLTDIYKDTELLSTLSIRHSLGLMNDLHSNNTRDVVYQKMVEQVDQKLNKGTRVILMDGNFNKKERREAIYALSAKYCATMIVIECKVNHEEELMDRLNYRALHEDDISQQASSMELYHLIKNSSDPIWEDMLPNKTKPIILEYETESQELTPQTGNSLTESENELITHIRRCLVPKKNNHKPKAFIFDIGGVIQSLRWETVTNELTRIKKELTIDQFRSAFYHEKENYFGLYEVSKMDFTTYWSMVAGQLGIPKTNLSILRKALTRLYGPVDQDLANIIKGLRPHYKLFILSNSCPELKENVDKNSSFYTIFDDIYFSFKIGLKKPDDKSFLYVLEQNHLRSKDCVFIDDTTINVNAAEDLGMKGILYQYPRKLMKELKKIL